MYVLGGINSLIDMLLKQLSSFWDNYDKDCIADSINRALERLNDNMSDVSSTFKYAWDVEGNLYFNPYNTCEYCVFLYYLSNALYKQGAEREAGCVYWLNKIMNQIEMFYAVELPTHFWVEHPIGSVLGKAKYGEYLFFNQGVTVGGSVINLTNPSYPIIGDNVTLCAGSMVLGECTIGDNVVVGSGTIIKNQDVPSNCVVFGESPNIVIKERGKNSHVQSLWEIREKKFGVITKLKL